MSWSTFVSAALLLIALTLIFGVIADIVYVTSELL